MLVIPRKVISSAVTIDKLCGTSKIGVGVLIAFASLIDKYVPCTVIFSIWPSAAVFAFDELANESAIAIADNFNFNV